jgi:hypothetical protein
MSGDLKTYARALETYEPSYIGRPASIFFMLESYDPQEIAGHAGTGALGGRIQRRGTRGAPKPSPRGRQDLELYDI